MEPVKIRIYTPEYVRSLQLKDRAEPPEIYARVVAAIRETIYAHGSIGHDLVHSAALRAISGFYLEDVARVNPEMAIYIIELLKFKYTTWISLSRDAVLREVEERIKASTGRRVITVTKIVREKIKVPVSIKDLELHERHQELWAALQVLKSWVRELLFEDDPYFADRWADDGGYIGR